MSESEGEVIIEAVSDINSREHHHDQIMTCRTYFPRLQFTQHGCNDIEIIVPTSILPRHLAVVNRFHESTTLLECRFSLCGSFQIPCRSVTMSNPVYGSFFPGRCLVLQTFATVLSASYRPTGPYRCESLIFECDEIDSFHLQALLSEGYSESAASEALRLTHDNLMAARNFLFSGVLICDSPLTNISHHDYPLFYLVLEIVESFFKLFDHCSVCGKDLEVSGVKPSLCDSPVCFFSVAEIGLHASVMSELRRDLFVADFLVCLASTAYRTKFFVPPLPDQLNGSAISFFAGLPPMATLAQCANDTALRTMIGVQHYEILRFILTSNRAHLVHLPDCLKISECAHNTEQLLCVTAAPERELAFRKKKGDTASAWLWHGSTATRWHSILHTSLQDLGKSPDRTHLGADTFGPGVYQSHLSSVSIWYCAGQSFGASNAHLYKSSVLPASLTVLALVENIKGPLLNQVADVEWTQKDLDGLVVRCLLIVKKEFEWNLVQKPPAKVPTLDECLDWFASHPDL
jgi:hypothetical protein